MNDYPHDSQIDSKILMDQFVAHPGHSLPWNGISTFTDNIRDLLCGFAEYLQTANYSVPCFDIHDEIFKRKSPGELKYFVDRAQNIHKVVARVSDHSITTSAKI